MRILCNAVALTQCNNVQPSANKQNEQNSNMNPSARILSRLAVKRAMQQDLTTICVTAARPLLVRNVT